MPHLTDHPVFCFDSFVPLYNWVYPLSGRVGSVRIDLNESAAFAPFHGASARALYVHIPFCDTICSFCPFSRGRYRQQDELDAYVEALLHEIRLKGKHASLAGPPVRAVFYGGGTPSLLSAEQVGRIQGALSDWFDLSGVEEVSFECEVKSMRDRSQAEALAEHGITHGRFGLQTLSPRHRTFFDLSATVEDVSRCVELLGGALPHVSCDLLFGMHGQTLDELEHDLVGAVALGLDNIDLYPVNNLVVQPRLLRAWRDAGAAPTSGLTRFYMRQFARERLQQLGFVPHNGHGFVRLSRPVEPGQTDPVVSDQYRFVYHEHVLGPSEWDLLGFGTNAISSTAGLALQNHGSRSEYVHALAEDRLSMVVKRHGPAVDAARAIALTLPYFGRVETRHAASPDLPEDVRARLDAAIERGLVVVDGDWLRLGRSGWDWYTELMAWLLPAPERAAVDAFVAEARAARGPDLEPSGLDHQVWAGSA